MTCLACVSQLGGVGIAGEVSAAFTENVKPNKRLKIVFTFMFLGFTGGS